MSDALPDATYRSLARFRHSLRQFLRFSEEAARQAGLTPAQHQLLLAIRGHEGDGPASLTDVAELLQLKLHSASELVGRAAARGLVERWQDRSDGRRTSLGLTDAGRAKLAELSVLHRDELRRFRREMVAALDELE